MCELLGLSARYPATLRLSLDEFARHGGETGPHRDGWGMAFHEGRDLRRYRGLDPASSSELVRFMDTHPHRSTIAMAHIRFATRGERRLENTQPFSRSLGGVRHSFAHNGDLPALLAGPPSDMGFHRPLGTTDSERAFCILLGGLEPLWLAAEGPSPPSIGQRMDVFAQFCRQMRAHGPANFLYADGEYLFAHAHKRKQPDGTFAPPGLHRLERHCPLPKEVTGGGARIESHDPEQVVQLVASVPLTEEDWHPVPPGTTLAMKGGEVVAQITT